MKNPLLPITEAEEVIDQRRLLRETQRPENRTHLALEAIADEMTRMRAELAVLRAAILELRGGAGKAVRTISGEVDPVHRRNCVGRRDESRFHSNGNGCRRNGLGERRPGRWRRSKRISPATERCRSRG